MTHKPELGQANPTWHVLDDAPDFSLVAGGPLYQLYLRARLVRPPLELVGRRIITISLICWLPLFVLALIAGNAFGGVPFPFLHDLGIHVRFLLAMPLLIGSELFAHRRIGLVVRQFLERGIISQKEGPRFDNIIASTLRLRNFVLVELALALFVVVVAVWSWKVGPFSVVSTWYATNVGGETHFTPAGYWNHFVSLSILRFMLLRWYFRFFLWYRFLWRVRGLPLHLNLFHPDRAAGLGFLDDSVPALAPVLVAQMIVLAGAIGDRIWSAGATLTNFKAEIGGAFVFLTLLPLIPLSFFMVQIEGAERKAKREYGVLASRYVEDFRRKWIQERGDEREDLLGTSDIQSLADLGNAYGVVSEIRLLPMSKATVLRVAALILLPLLPLVLTVVPVDKIVERLVKLIF